MLKCRRILLRDWLQQWLESEVSGSVKDSSYQTYLRQIQTHLIPKLVDLETTGLQPVTDDIIEMAALRVENGQITSEYQCFIRTEKPIPPAITELTGITSQTLKQKGVSLDQAMQGLLDLAGQVPLVFHNAAFDHRFLLMACKRYAIDALPNRVEDTLALARRKLKHLPDYKLSTLATHFGIAQTTSHRAMDDCRTTCELYIKLNENG